MTIQQRFWALALGIPTSVEIWAAATGRQEWTLSPHGRAFLRTDTKVGAAVTIILVGSGAAWLSHHFLTQPVPR